MRNSYVRLISSSIPKEPFSDRIISVMNGPYSLRSTLAKLQAVGTSDTISFGLGAPDLPPPPEAIEACYKAMKENRNSYTPIPGLPALRELIASMWHSYEPSLGIDNVMVTMSGTNAIMATLQCILNPTDSIMLPDPYFAPYGGYVGFTDAQIIHYPCKFENQFVPDVDDLEKLVLPNTKAIMYNFPSNPTGGMISDSQRDALTEFARSRGIWIVSDEVYNTFVYDDQKHVSFLDSGYDRVIMVNSFSKTLAMPGWRLGYVLSKNKEAMQYIMKAQEYLVTCSNEPMQYGVMAALTTNKDYPTQMAKIFQRRRDSICSRLNNIEGVSCHVPQGSFFVFPKVNVPGMNSLDIAIELNRGGVLCSPGSVFGQYGEGHLRFCFTLPDDDIERGMDRAEQVLKRLLATQKPVDTRDLEKDMSMFM